MVKCCFPHHFFLSKHIVAASIFFNKRIPFYMHNNFVKTGLIVALSSLTFMACKKDNNNNNNNDTKDMHLYVTNTSDGNVTMYDLEADEMKTLRTTSTSTEGVYYDGDKDKMLVNSRSSNRVDAYTNVSDLSDNDIATIAFSGAADLASPRDIAVNNGMVVVADNSDVDGDSNTPDGRLYVYTKTDNSMTLRNIIITDFAVWGIEFIGNDLYAIVDKTNMLAVYNNFLDAYATTTTASPDKKIMIEGIVRTHGIAYDGGTMILTDIGDAGSDSDGGFHIISDFQNKFNGVSDGGMLMVAGNQVRVAGAATMLGNPVAAEYDADKDMVYIAEIANGGGRVLGFSSASTGGDLTPSWNKMLAKASSLYLYMED